MNKATSLYAAAAIIKSHHPGVNLDATLTLDIVEIKALQYMLNDLLGPSLIDSAAARGSNDLMELVTICAQISNKVGDQVKALTDRVSDLSKDAT